MRTLVVERGFATLTMRTCTLNLGEISTRDRHGRLIVDTTFESRRTPVDKLNGTLGLDSSNCHIDLLWNDISTVHETTGHVFTMAGVAFGHHIGWFKHTGGNFSDGKTLMEGLFIRNDGGVTCQHKMDTRIWHQVCKEGEDTRVRRLGPATKRHSGAGATYWSGIR